MPTVVALYLRFYNTPQVLQFTTSSTIGCKFYNNKTRCYGRQRHSARILKRSRQSLPQCWGFAMSITRRLAMTGASAFALVGSSTQSSIASAAKNYAKRLFAGRGFRNTQTSQRFLELLIHRDESRNQPHRAEVSIAANDTAWYAIDTLDETKYRATNEAYKKRGYRLRRVAAFKTKEGPRFSACWELTSGPAWHSRHGMAEMEFNNSNAEFAKHGYRLAYFDTHLHYAAIWEKGDASTQKVLTALTQSQYEQQRADLISRGLRPYKLSVTAENGTPAFAALFDKDPGTNWQSYHQLGVTDFQKMNKAMQSQGYRLTDASGYMLGHKPTFAGIWEKI